MQRMRDFEWSPNVSELRWDLYQLQGLNFSPIGNTKLMLPRPPRHRRIKTGFSLGEIALGHKHLSQCLTLPLSLIYLIRVETLPSKTPTGPLEDFFILESCFNLPTIAHLSLAVSVEATQPQFSAGRRLLLLFCMNGHEKALNPATLEQKIMVINMLLAEEL